MQFAGRINSGSALFSLRMDRRRQGRARSALALKYAPSSKARKRLPLLIGDIWFSTKLHFGSRSVQIRRCRSPLYCVPSAKRAIRSHVQRTGISSARVVTLRSIGLTLEERETFFRRKEEHQNLGDLKRSERPPRRIKRARIGVPRNAQRAFCSLSEDSIPLKSVAAGGRSALFEPSCSHSW